MALFKNMSDKIIGAISGSKTEVEKQEVRLEAPKMKTPEHRDTAAILEINAYDRENAKQIAIEKTLASMGTTRELWMLGGKADQRKELRHETKELHANRALYEQRNSLTPNNPSEAKENQINAPPLKLEAIQSHEEKRMAELEKNPQFKEYFDDAMVKIAESKRVLAVKNELKEAKEITPGITKK